MKKLILIMFAFLSVTAFGQYNLKVDTLKLKRGGTLYKMVISVTGDTLYLNSDTLQGLNSGWGYDDTPGNTAVYTLDEFADIKYSGAEAYGSGVPLNRDGIVMWDITDQRLYVAQSAAPPDNGEGFQVDGAVKNVDPIDYITADTSTSTGFLMWDAADSTYKTVSKATINAAKTMITYTTDTVKYTGYLNLPGGIHVGDSQNYLDIDSIGNLRLYGEATQWEDLRLEPVARTSGTGAPAFTVPIFTNGSGSKGVGGFVFTDESVTANEKEVYFSAQMPHGWVGDTIHMHVHWIGMSSQTSQTPRWGFEYNMKEPGETFGNTLLDYATGNEQSDANVVAYKHYITEFTVIVPSSTQNGPSSIMIGRVFRSSSNAADTYNSQECVLLYLDLHYKVDSFGSNKEYIK